MSIFRPPYAANHKAAERAGAQLYAERLIAKHNKAAKKKGVKVFANGKEKSKSTPSISSFRKMALELMNSRGFNEFVSEFKISFFALALIVFFALLFIILTT